MSQRRVIANIIVFFLNKEHQQGNQESGGSVVEMAEAEYMVRASGFLKSLDDFRSIVLASRNGVPVLIADAEAGVVGAASMPAARWAVS